MEELDEGWVILTYEVRCLSLEFLNDKVGTKMAKKEPKFLPRSPWKIECDWFLQL
jgi:hypothetical protein